MGEEKEIQYEYRGNQFCLEKLSSWYSKWTSYTIKGIKVMSSQLYLPDSCQGNPVIRWHMREKESISGVQFLFIPSTITEIFIHNRIFPELNQVEVQAGHTKFSTDGLMLYSADGRGLLYSLAAGLQRQAVVPWQVRRISRTAFPDTSCSEIIFENPDVSVEEGAFHNSAWIKAQGDFCIVGNLFFRLNHSMERLAVPDGVRRFHESAFSGAVPKYLDTPVLPSKYNMEDLGGKGYKQCTEEITIRSRKAKIDFGTLRKARGLAAIRLPEGHKDYCSADGVIFSKDGRTLEYYPQGKYEKRYEIPMGVVKIARSAFAGQRYLEELIMPDSVTNLGMGAFCSCSRLRKVVFSGNLREIPDASAYQKGGVFEECVLLEEAQLPGKLQYLGSYAFYASGLKQITLNDGLRQVGEYALAANRLGSISLPPTVERLGKGALLYVHTLRACIGTAKGLVSAVNAAPPELTDKCANVDWTRCVVQAYRKRSDREECFLIPGSLKRNAAYHLDMAWNGDSIDYSEYDACFNAIIDTEERLEFARFGILRTGRGEDSPYTSYLRHSAIKVAASLLEERAEEDFLAFLRLGYLSDAALSKLLKMTNQSGLTTCSAYILKEQDRRGSRKGKRFVL